MGPRRAAVALALALAAAAAPAWAHGEKIRTDPDDGDTLPRPPRRVSVTLTEPPTREAVFEVTDGCGDAVVAEIAIDGEELEARIGGGSPGRWHARYRVISAVDGHPTDGRWHFSVDGERDCGDGDGHGDGDGDGTDDGDDVAESPGPEPTVVSRGDDGDGEGEDGGVPVVALTAGAVGLVALALVARRFGAR